MFNVMKRSLTTLSPLKHSPVNLNKLSLTGRDFIKPKNLTCDEVKSLLWTAFDLKKCKKQLHDKNINLDNVKVSLLLRKPTLKTKFALNNAARLLNVNVNTIMNNTHDFGENYEELGQMLNCFSDIIFCENDEQDEIQKIADGASIPVIGVKSYEHSLIQVLADLMTMQEHYNHLKGLKFCWVGLHGPLINSYLCFLPHFGIDINYLCVDNESNCVSPCLLKDALQFCQQYGAEIHECTSVKQATYRCDVIATSCHNHEKLRITKNYISNAAINWTLLSSFPRGKEVDSDMYRHKNCLTWKSLCNLQWIYASIIIRFLKNYNHVTEEPPFDDIEAGYVKYK